MSDPFVGEIRMFAGNFAPSGWAHCAGQLLPISQNTALFSLLGTNYGGNGTSTFALPDLRGATPVHLGQGPGLSPYDIGQSGGAAAVALTVDDLPAHTHPVSTVAAGTRGTTGNPSGAAWARSQQGRTTEKLYTDDAGTVAMHTGSVGSTGAGAPHENRSPYLGVTFIIALQGFFPPRS
ncbi:phage tail protein [Actinotalea sp. BY-33]|uniref:Phage tail protein n=1 Tax=Actinotalea soli TaxID=2819234 RepID=A0A939LPK3_9CELL|nr:tail fiber protein [Actinotalea soli]MBO1752046.1 phage tail protein [Actinotalea soli]